MENIPIPDKVLNKKILSEDPTPRRAQRIKLNLVAIPTRKNCRIANERFFYSRGK